jgi:DNA-binding MarR family transcriptional regulator
MTTRGITGERQPGRDPLTLPLPQGTEGIEAIARKLSLLADELSVDPVPAQTTAEATGAFARRLRNERRLRDAAFGGQLFGEPAWDMLLDLYASEQEGRTVSAAGLSRAAGVPATTALRYLNTMLAQGLISKPPAAGDGPAPEVRLTDSARDRMTALLDRMLASRRGPNRADEAPDRHGPR